MARISLSHILAHTHLPLSSTSSSSHHHHYLLLHSNLTRPEEQKSREKKQRSNQRSNHSSSSSMSKRLKQSLGQSFNSAGIASFLKVIAKEPHLALPHISVPDIRWIDWSELETLGFRGVVFDKDNTLTAPYSLSLWPPLSHSLNRCRSAFPGRIAVLSNSAGLRQYDPDGLEAEALEESIRGVHVIRHEMKKPAGTAEDIEKYFGCSASLLVMVGDRHSTDVVYGNRHGFLTILTEPLSLSEEPLIVKQVRKLEGFLVNCWNRKGLKPANHSLLSQTTRCVKVPSL